MYKPAGGQPTDTGTITSIDGSIIFEVKCWSGVCLYDNLVLLVSFYQCHLWRHLTLATCYQLMQFILKIGFAGRGRWAGIFKTCCAHGGCHGWL